MLIQRRARFAWSGLTRATVSGSRILNRLCAAARSPGCIAVAVMSGAGTTELSHEEFDALVVMART